MAEAEAQEATAQAAQRAAGDALETAWQSAEAARLAEIRAAATCESAGARSERAALALAGTERPDEALAGLQAALPDLRQAFKAAETQRACLEAEAPDLDSTEATLTRLAYAMKAAEDDLPEEARRCRERVWYAFDSIGQSLTSAWNSSRRFVALVLKISFGLSRRPELRRTDKGASLRQR